MFPQRLSSQVRPLLVLIAGLVIGFSFSQMLRYSNCAFELQLPYANGGSGSGSGSGSGGGNRAQEAEYADNAVTPLDAAETPPMSRTSDDDDDTLANRLFNETRVLCWVLTSPDNHEKRALHVKKTWGKRCNKLIFMSTKADAELGAVQLPVGEGRGNLWHKTREAVRYIYEQHFDEADWFLKADDDTYVILENLRAFLYPHSADAPVYFGCKFKQLVRQGYMSGGAGYVLSKEALRRFAVDAYTNPKICRRRPGGAEDKEMGICLQNVGVVAGDSRDEHKRGRFFPSGPQGHLIPKNKSHWYWRYIYYKTEDGLDCCSDYAISFHYIQPSYMYVLDYLIYNLRPFGIARTVHELPAKLNTTALLEKWRNEGSDNPQR